MRLSILAEDNKITVEAPVVNENTDKQTRDPSQFADEESQDVAEYLVIGHPPGSLWRHVQHAAGFGVVAAVALTTWLLPGSSNNETDLLPLISSAPPQQAVPMSDGVSAGGYATPLEPVAAYAQFCQNNPTLCVPMTPSALRKLRSSGDSGYIQFCQNSRTLCTVAKPR